MPNLGILCLCNTSKLFTGIGVYVQNSENLPLNLPTNFWQTPQGSVCLFMDASLKCIIVKGFCLILDQCSVNWLVIDLTTVGKTFWFFSLFLFVFHIIFSFSLPPNRLPAYGQWSIVEIDMVAPRHLSAVFLLVLALFTSLPLPTILRDHPYITSSLN